MDVKLRVRRQLAHQGFEFCRRVLFERARPTLILPPKATPEAPRSNGKGLPYDRDGEAKSDTFAIRVNDGAAGVVPVDLERGVPVARWRGKRQGTVEGNCGR